MMCVFNSENETISFLFFSDKRGSKENEYKVRNNKAEEYKSGDGNV